MQNRNLDWLIVPHIVLFVWATHFCISLAINNGSLAHIFAVGSICFLFFGIPLGIFSIVCVVKKRVGKRVSAALTGLSILNILYGIAACCFFILVFKMH